MATQNKGMETPAHGDDVNTWDVPVNANTATLDAALGGHAAISVTSVGTGPTALTLAQYQNMSLAFSGVLSNAVNYQLPTGVGGQWVVQNSTTGAFNLVISSAGGGTTVTVPQGSTRTVYSDGTNVIYADSQTSSAVSDTQVIFDSSGTLTGSSAMTFNGTSLTANLLTSTELPIVAGTTGTLSVARGGTGVTTSTGTGAVVLQSAATLTGTTTVATLQFGDATTQTTAAKSYEAAEQATTSGTSFTFSSIMAGLNFVYVIFHGVSLSGTDQNLIRLGTGAVLKTTGYRSASTSFVGTVTDTTGFVQLGNAASTTVDVVMSLVRIPGTYTWEMNSAGYDTGTSRFLAGNGIVTLTGPLDTIQLRATGSNTFVAGGISVRGTS